MVGRYTIGTFVGEEWIYDKKYVEREETCRSCDSACVLSITVEAFEEIRQALLAAGQSKDMTVLEMQIKRSYNIKKARGIRP